MPDGKQVDLFTLTNKNGVEAKISNYGGTVVSLFTPDKNGKMEDVVLGFETLDEYLKVLDRLFLEAKDKGAVCLKSTLAYQRTLQFDRVPPERAEPAAEGIAPLNSQVPSRSASSSRTQPLLSCRTRSFMYSICGVSCR